VYIDVSGRADEVAEPEAPALRRRGMGRSVNDRVDAGDRLGHPVAGRQVARDPLNPWVDAGSAGENAYLVALLAQTRHDDASEVSGPSRHEDSHLPLLFIAGDCDD
jgi:hypothetical protein